jgi:hypothetical protein
MIGIWGKCEICCDNRDWSRIDYNGRKIRKKSWRKNHMVQ